MTRILALVVPVILLLALVVGMVAPGRPPEPLGVIRGAGAIAGLTLRPGESTVEAVRFLRTLRSDPAPPAPPPPPSPIVLPPPPPPPDVSVVFKAALGGIARDPQTGTYTALVRNAAAGPQIGAMKVGDVFGDGWKIREISADAVTLSRGRDVRVVRLYG